MRVPEILPLQFPQLLFLFDRFRQHPFLRALRKNVVVVVNVEHQVRAVLLGQRDAFVVDQAGVLNGIDPGADGIFDGLRAVRVRRHLAPQFVRLFRDGLSALPTCIAECRASRLCSTPRPRRTP